MFKFVSRRLGGNDRLQIAYGRLDGGATLAPCLPPDSSAWRGEGQCGVSDELGLDLCIIDRTAINLGHLNAFIFSHHLELDPI